MGQQALSLQTWRQLLGMQKISLMNGILQGENHLIEKFSRTFSQNF
jgi:hypothetical protein